MFVNSDSRIPIVSGLLSNAGMVKDVGATATRRAKLEILIAEAGSLEAIGEAMRVAAARRGDKDAAVKNYANYVSQLRGDKAIGNKTARLLEDSMGKEPGWLDALQLDAIDKIMEAKESAQLAANMSAEKRALWLQIGRAWAGEGPPNAGRPFVNLNPASEQSKPAKKRTTRKAPKPKRRRKGGGNA